MGNRLLRPFRQGSGSWLRGGFTAAALIAALAFLGACQAPVPPSALPAAPTSAPTAQAAPRAKRGPAAAQPKKIESEAELLQTLQSAATPAEKDAACVRLKHLGTARCVPALAALLLDEQLAHSACSVLEAMSAPEAGQCLIDALGRTTGLTKAGIATALGVRREVRAVPPLVRVLGDSEGVAATAAATALGEIGTAEALAALENVEATAPAALQTAAVDARLRAAQRLLAAGRQARAFAAFQQLHATAPTAGVRLAAFRGRLLAAGSEAVALASAAIAGPAGPEQTAALQIVHELAAPGATAAFARLLPQANATVRAALIEGLSQRQDPLAAPAIAALVGDPSPEVRRAALTALGQLGDGTCVEALLDQAAASGPEQAVAREALLTLRRGEPAKVLLAQLPNARPAVQAEIARALAGRRERAAIPGLLSAATSGTATAAKAAVLALSRLADFEPAAFAALVRIAGDSRDEEIRAAAVTGLQSACQHLRARRGRVDVAPLLPVLAQGSVEARVALWPVCAQLADPAVRDALRTAQDDAAPQVRAAARAALCDSVDVELLPDLAAIARTAPEVEIRRAAVAACVRLGSDAADLPEARRLGVLQEALAQAVDSEQKQLVLGALAEIATPEGLRTVARFLAEPAVRAAAAQAVLKIAPLLVEVAPGVAALEQAVAVLPSGPTRQAAEQALRQSRHGYGYLVAWQVAGPFKQEGRDYADLFDFVFRPESADPQGTNWESRYSQGTAARGGAPGGNRQALPAAAHPWRVDLHDRLGTQECVAYAETWLRCREAQSVQIQIGSNCPAKVWLGGQLLHTHPAMRVLRPDSDTFTATLRPGWNRLLVKLAQREQAAAFSLRLLQPSGEPLDDLQISATLPKAD